MLLTLAQVKAGPVGRSCGIATTSPDFTSIVNDATRQLMTRGNWWSSVQPMALTIGQNRTIICPREVATVLAMNLTLFGGRRIQSRMSNLWFEYLPWTDGIISWAASCRGSFHEVAASDGYVVVTSQFKSPNYIRVTSSSPLDAGKNISFFGLDQNGAPASCTIQMSSTFASSYPQQFSVVSRVAKDMTSGYVTCQQDDNNGNLLPLSIYEPSEQSPEYVLMKLMMHGMVSLVANALVKLSFIPVVNDTDRVLIENQDALRDMVLSIRKKESGDLASAAGLEKSAMLELNHQMRNRFPDEQFQARILPFGKRPQSLYTY